jgi:hypothetical protein
MVDLASGAAPPPIPPPPPGYGPVTGQQPAAGAGWAPQSGIADTVITHRGQFYGAGYGPNFCAVWDLRPGGAVVGTFERSQVGWQQAWERFQELEQRDTVPQWRQAKPGWVVLHIALGLVVWFLSAIVLAIVIQAAGRDLSGLSDAQNAAVGMTLFTSLAGWLLFVFLRQPAITRWIVFAAVLGGGLLLSVVLVLSLH